MVPGHAFSPPLDGICPAASRDNGIAQPLRVIGRDRLGPIGLREVGMEPILASNGQYVDEATIDQWCGALDRDEWPGGERSVGPVMQTSPAREWDELPRGRPHNVGTTRYA